MFLFQLHNQKDTKEAQHEASADQNTCEYDASSNTQDETTAVGSLVT